MRMEQYLQCIDYTLWEIVENGNAPIVTKTVNGKETAIKNRFGGNTATKKTQKNLLNQQYENFTASSTEVIEKTYERIQKIISQLEMDGERNKPEIKTLSLDDLFNNLKAYESEVKGTSSLTTNSHHVAFLSSRSTNNATRAVNIAQGINTVSTQGVADSSTTVKNLRPQDFPSDNATDADITKCNYIDLVNPKGHRIIPDISNPFPLGGPPAYGITHWWFNRKQFYINKHSEPSDRDAVRSHMRILSVISIKTYERYGYNYLREIVLRRADYNEYKISEKDFKSLHHNDFEDLNILHIQGKLDHLPKQDKDASDLPFKEDYTIVFKPRAVIYRDRDDNRKMMRINKGMENKKWTEDDKRRSEDFIEVIERRLKIRRIFRSLESFVDGRLRDIDYRLISRTE
ncbi:hypothetical protein Tco_0693897 [Tanacetum coccineum]